MTTIYQKCCRKDSFDDGRKGRRTALRILRGTVNEQHVPLAVSRETEISSPLGMTRLYLVPSYHGLLRQGFGSILFPAISGA